MLAGNLEQRRMSELVPWMVMITNRLVLNKDGSLMAVYVYEGIDLEGRVQEEVESSVKRLETAMRVLNARVTIWSHMERRQDKEVAGLIPKNAFGAILAREQVKSLLATRSYRNRHYMTIMLSPKTQADRFFGLFAELNRSGMGVASSLIEATKLSMSGSSRFAYEARELSQYAIELERMLEQFTAGLSELGINRLAGEELIGRLHEHVTPTETPRKLKLPEDAYLDSALGGARMFVQTDGVWFEGQKNRHMAALSVKVWPDESTPGILDDLLAVDAELTVSQCYRVLDYEAAKKYLTQVRRHNLNMRKGLLTLALEEFTKRESDNVNNDRERAAFEADEALDNLAENGTAGWFNLTILVWADTTQRLEESIQAVYKRLQSKDFVLLRESIHAVSAWAGTLPGQWGEIERWVFFSGQNMCDLMFLRALKSGDLINRHLSEQASKAMPALATFKTRHLTNYHFNFHNGDLGHFLVVGPTRSGKSSLLNFLMAKWRQYDPSRLIIFDKDWSCRIPTGLMDGKHLDLGREHVRINPLLELENENDLTWAAQWVESLIASKGYRVTSDDTKHIWSAIEGVSKLPVGTRKLASVAFQLPRHLVVELEPWINSGPLASFFDHKEDDFTLSDHTTMEMGEIMLQPAAARAFLDYAFHRIQKMLDGRPTLIYIEEAWFMLEDEHFVRRLNNWLRTLAKRNAIIGMATQSLMELSQSSIFSVIVDSIPTKIYLPNRDALQQRDLYRDKLGLNEGQIQLIAKAIQKRDYILVNRSTTRVLESVFTPEAMAVIRSDIKAQEVFSRHMNSNNPKWKEFYYADINR